MERIVKGIWIPIEIWQAEDLSWNEKILLMEVDSFTKKDRECYISNRYIADMFGVSERTASEYLTHLINAGYVRLVKFDGRCRYVESALPSLQGSIEENFKADLKNTSRQGGKILQGTNNNRPSINIPDKEKSINTPKEKFNFRNSLINSGADAEIVDQWLEVRKLKKLANTELALRALIDEQNKARRSLNEVLRECVIRSWGGFKAEWLEREQNGGSRGARTEPKSNMQVIWERLQARENGTYNPNDDLPDLPDEQ